MIRALLTDSDLELLFFPLDQFMVDFVPACYSKEDIFFIEGLYGLERGSLFPCFRSATWSDYYEFGLF